MRNPRIFISYDKAELGWVQALADALEHLAVDVWFDPADSQTGQDWQESLTRGLKESDVYALVIGCKTLANPNVLFELGVASVSERPIVPIILSLGCSPELLINLANIQQIRTDDVQIAAEELKNVAQHYLDNPAKALRRQADIVERCAAVGAGRKLDTNQSKLLVSAGDRFASLKIVGRANFNASVNFKTVVSELLQKGYPYVVLELSECNLMDSTFLGVLAGFGLKANHKADGRVTHAIELRNANERVIELLENLGVLHLFRITQGNVPAPETVATDLPGPCEPSREELTRTSLEAHRTLMELNPENAARFKGVTKFLAEDLHKICEKPPTSAPSQLPV